MISYKWLICSSYHFCSIKYNHKTFEQIKARILTYCLEKWRRLELFEVQRTVAPKGHKKYK